MYFQLPYMKKPVFSKQDVLLLKVPARLYWNLLTSGMVLASLSLFLKSEKLPEKDPSTGPSVIFDVFPQITGLGHTSQITEGPYSGPSPIQNSIPILYMR